MKVSHERAHYSGNAIRLIYTLCHFRRGDPMKSTHALYVCAAVALSFSTAAPAQTLIQEPTISADAAQELATTALAYCRKEGHKVSITVLDNAGRPKATLRDDGAAPHSYEHSLRKAYTALTYNMPSAEYGKRAAANPGAIGP